MSSVFTPRSRSTSYSDSPKSSPTGPTTRTSVKKLAASEKCTAEPPSMRSRSPKGVFTASKAIDPTTTRLIGAGSLASRRRGGTQAAHPLAVGIEQRLLCHLGVHPVAEHLDLHSRTRRGQLGGQVGVGDRA